MDRLTHRVHQDLLAQVAGSEEEEREVRRILSEPLKLRESDLDAHERWKRAPFAVGRATHAHRYSACASGPCAGGTKLCPSPAACQISDDADAPRPPRRLGDVFAVVALLLASWAAVAFTLMAMGVRL